MPAHTSAERLLESVRSADAALAGPRRRRRVYLNHYLGETADGGPDGPQPLNLLYAMASVVLPHVTPRRPRAMVRARRRRLSAAAETLQRHWNRLAEEIDLARTLRVVVADALFGAGIVKVGVAPSVVGGAPDDPGRPFADAVDLDDYLVDPEARDRHEAAFEGNRYRMRRCELLTGEWFDPAAVERLAERRDRAGAASDAVELVDLYLPAERVVVTLPGDGASPPVVLREAPWEGPERGPYEMLGFHWAPGRLMPLPPVAAVFDLHVMVNRVAARLARQAERQKDLILFDDRAAEEAETLRDAADGEMVGVQNVDRYRQVSFGGANELGYRHLEFLFEQFRRIGGNTDLLGGLAPASPTLGQDELLYAGAAGRLEDMQAAVRDFTRHLGRKLAWCCWRDPLDGPAAAGPGGQEVGDGDFADCEFDIEPHSLAPDTPARRYARTVEWIHKVLLPTADAAAAQGRPIDAAALARSTAGLLNIDPDAVPQPDPEGE